MAYVRSIGLIEGAAVFLYELSPFIIYHVQLCTFGSVVSEIRAVIPGIAPSKCAELCLVNNEQSACWSAPSIR